LVQQQRRLLSQNPERAEKVAGAPSNEAQAIELAAWASVGRVLLNLDEFITRE
jgi:hypothetical protein